MSVVKPRVKLVPVGSVDAFKDALLTNTPQTLRALLACAPARSMEPIKPAWLDLLVNSQISVSVIEDVAPGCTLHLPPDMTVRGDPAPPSGPSPSPQVPPAAVAPPIPGPVPTAAAPTEIAPPPAGAHHPEQLDDRQTVVRAHYQEIRQVAAFLRAGLSVLVVCDKLIVRHLGTEMVQKAGLKEEVLNLAASDPAAATLMSPRQQQFARLKEQIQRLKEGMVLVVPHLDLLAGGADTLSSEARELTEILFDQSACLMLAFADRSLELPEVLSARFAVRYAITGVQRVAHEPDGTPRRLCEALVTRSEAAQFIGFDAVGLYKHVAGMNPLRLRDAIKYAVAEEARSGPVAVSRLVHAIRAFKAQTSAKFEVPEITFDQIGGYEGVKRQILEALRLMKGATHLPDEALRRELIPRGLLFHGPPGTGKTLFAKAIAKALDATILVVSGPEVTDKYVGESKRKVRDLFAEARRNAPSVLVFDEFDAIATERTARDDGGSRAGNALVAQILTEMDGFRPEVPMLVIGSTNRLDIIDEALLRPSRFRPIGIERPDMEARRAIAKIHAKTFHLLDQTSEALFDLIAHYTEGFNGDEIRSLFRDACVGQFCNDPPVMADASRFGFLVGSIRRGLQQREADKASRRSPTARMSRPSPPAPTSTMYDLA